MVEEFLLSYTALDRLNQFPLSLKSDAFFVLLFARNTFNLASKWNCEVDGLAVKTRSLS